MKLTVRVDTDRVEHRLGAVDNDRRVGSLVRIDPDHEHRMVLLSWLGFAAADTPDAWLMPFLFRATPRPDLAGWALRLEVNHDGDRAFGRHTRPDRRRYENPRNALRSILNQGNLFACSSPVKRGEVRVAEIMNRLLSAMNAHDVDAFVACFASDYESQQPSHPGRSFRGSDQVRKNWTSVFAGVPDFTAELVLSAVTAEGVEVGEWRWRGTHQDGSPFGMQGVIVAGVQHGLIAWGRLYMEPIEQGGANIDEMVQDTYRPGQ